MSNFLSIIVMGFGLCIGFSIAKGLIALLVSEFFTLRQRFDDWIHEEDTPDREKEETREEDRTRS